MGDLRTAEAVSIAYFACLALLAWARPTPLGSRLLATGLAVAVCLGVAAVAAWTGNGRPGALIRDGLPLALLLLAYWAPRALVTAPHTGLERWLLRLDAGLLDSRAGRAVRDAPRWVRELLELSYLMVYPLVPLSLAILWATGFAGEVDRFWTTVLLSEYVCYGLLPLFPTRPPRALETPGPRSAGSFARTLNGWVLAHASNRWNTFPSGHVAGALACGLALSPSVPLAGAAVVAMAMLIALASVAGRYHYAADAVAGVLVALVAFGIARA